MTGSRSSTVPDWLALASTEEGSTGNLFVDFLLANLLEGPRPDDVPVAQTDDPRTPVSALKVALQAGSSAPAAFVGPFGAVIHLLASVCLDIHVAPLRRGHPKATGPSAAVSTEVVARREREDLEKAFEHLFRAAEGVHFEDGMESPFSRGLIKLVQTGGEEARELLTYWVLRQKCPPDVASEALRWVGAMEDLASRGFRRWLLERCLDLPSPVVRDGAALGLAALDDPHSAPSVRRAIEREQSDELRGLLGQVLAQLEE